MAPFVTTSAEPRPPTFVRNVLLPLWAAMFDADKLLRRYRWIQRQQQGLILGRSMLRGGIMGAVGELVDVLRAMRCRIPCSLMSLGLWLITLIRPRVLSYLGRRESILRRRCNEVLRLRETLSTAELTRLRVRIVRTAAHLLAARQRTAIRTCFASPAARMGNVTLLHLIPSGRVGSWGVAVARCAAYGRARLSSDANDGAPWCELTAGGFLRGVPWRVSNELEPVWDGDLSQLPGAGQYRAESPETERDLAPECVFNLQTARSVAAFPVVTYPRIAGPATVLVAVSNAPHAFSGLDCATVKSAARLLAALDSARSHARSINRACRTHHASRAAL